MKLPDELHRIPKLIWLHVRIDNDRSRCNHHAHRRKHSHRGGQRNDLADGLFLLTVTKAREVRHVQTQRRPESDHRSERWNEDFPEFTDGVELALLS